MRVETKDAVITAVDQAPDSPHGSFSAVLSAPTKDRDGETLLPEEWKKPLPGKIVMDIDHSMSVAGTVGSARPYLDPDTGSLMVDGTFASTAQGQQVRTLVNEGHITSLSVSFLSERVPAKDGKARIVRELLNGAFVAIPANREALVLSAKDVKAGARNAAADLAMIQGMHDATSKLGATCGKSFTTLAAPVAPPTDVAALALAVDAAMDAASAAMDGVDMAAMPPQVQACMAAMPAVEAAMAALLTAVNAVDPDDPNAPPTLSLTPPSPEAGATELAALHSRALNLTRTQYERNG